MCGCWCVAVVLNERCTLWTYSAIVLLLSVHGSGAEVKLNATAGIIVSQPIHIVSDEATDCGAEECYCYEVANCRRCSKLEMLRQLSKCMLTGYQQDVYCPSLKAQKHVSCHYKRDPNGVRKFWLFQLSILLVACACYAVVRCQLRAVEQKIAKRIEQQINA